MSFLTSVNDSPSFPLCPLPLLALWWPQGSRVRGECPSSLYVRGFWSHLLKDLLTLHWLVHVTLPSVPSEPSLNYSAFFSPMT